MPSQQPQQADADVPGGAAAEPSPASSAPGASQAALGPDGKPVPWDSWPGKPASFPGDIPLPGLMIAATRMLGVYGQHTVQAAGLKLSLSGLGVLRTLMATDGLKSSELAEQAGSTPGTITSVLNTLVKDGFVERRADTADRRLVRLYITAQGRAVITYYVTQMAPRWKKAFDFVDEADEAVVRRFFLQLIDQLNQLLREERGA